MATLKYYNTETEQWEPVSRAATAYPIVESQNEIIPGFYHVFGEVDNLSVTLADADSMKANEYCFEFIPSENFTELTITPKPLWVNEPQFIKGKTCQVSILRGIGVMISA